MTTPTMAQDWNEQEAQVNRFVERFGNETYKRLACYASLPLVLTPELIHYLRNEFLRDENVPWEAEVDLLLSDLCSQAGYELYTMDTQVRAYLLEEFQKLPTGPQHMREVAQVLISYVSYLSQIVPKHRRKELEAQRWAAMTYLGDDRCQDAVQEIAEQLKQLETRAETGEQSEQGIRAELARLTRITQELEPQLKEIPSLVSYAKLVQKMLRSPDDVDPMEVRQTFSVGNVDLTVSPQIFPTLRDQLLDVAAIAGFPVLEILTFRTGQLEEKGADQNESSPFPPLESFQVRVATLSFDDETGVLSEEASAEMTLKSLPIEVVTLSRDSDTGKWTQVRQESHAPFYEEYLGDDLVLEMMSIPEGTFVMGSPEDEPGRYDWEGPQHEVKVPAFCMGRYPVTQEQWRFIAGLPQVEQELEPDPSRFKGDDRPVEKVSWFDAVEFCQRLSRLTNREYRLPTEAEWEYACRAGTTTPFHFGETISSDLANYGGSEVYNDGPKGEYRKETTPVGFFGVANPFGLSDMHGNVLEWCEDQYHGSYEGAPTDGSAWFDPDDENANRILRGGSW
ncbi:MAG: formylglycine-generating enzyme family protein, partial [Cyanobacteria bacterium P01_A01_bin.17]